jgi:hypothetical protein
MYAQSQSQSQTHLGGSEGRGVQGVVGEDRGGGEQLAQRLPLPIDEWPQKPEEQVKWA